jgi:CRP-like cAMP-binding protein
VPKALTYRSNSVIYFQGDQADKIYILQKGKVSLTYSDIETGQDIHELIQMGEFFGVKSALGKYPREENALVLQDATVLMFTVSEFEQFSSQNIRIVLKMLKVFSNQLRRIQKQIETLLEKETQQSPEVGLYKTGEYYLKNRMYAQAVYVFSRYLTYYPAGRYTQDATRNLESSENSLNKYGQGKGPAPIVSGQPLVNAAIDDSKPASSDPQSQSQKISSAISELSPAAKQYYNGVSLFTQEKYQAAFLEFKKIVDANSDPEYVAKSLFEQGRCVFSLGQMDTVISHYSKMLQTYPKHPDLVDTLFYIGQAYEKKGDKAKAAGFYKKILSMQLDEDDSVHIKARRALKGIEG